MKHSTLDNLTDTSDYFKVYSDWDISYDFVLTSVPWVIHFLLLSLFIATLHIASVTSLSFIFYPSLSTNYPLLSTSLHFISLFLLLFQENCTLCQLKLTTSSAHSYSLNHHIFTLPTSTSTSAYQSSYPDSQHSYGYIPEEITLRQHSFT